jgi:hypothetical protein
LDYAAAKFSMEVIAERNKENWTQLVARSA